MSSEYLNKKQADQEVQEGTGQTSTDSTGTNYQVQTNNQDNQVGCKETSDIEDSQGEVMKSERWSSGKTSIFMKLACNAKTLQLPNPTHHSGKCTTSYQQLSLHLGRRTRLQEMHPVSVRLEPSSRHNPASATEGDHQYLTSQVSQTQLIRLAMMKPGMGHYSDHTRRTAPLS
jgi:hypothetical protein